MAKKTNSKLTPPFVASFANQLLKAKAFGDSDPVYSVTVVLLKDDPFWKRLEGELKACLVEKFGEVPKKINHWPIRDGDETEYDNFQGCYYMAPKRKETEGPPEIIDRDKEDIIDRAEVYSGMTCRISYRVYAWQHRVGGKGVSVALDNVQKLGDGPKIGRVASKALDDFESYVSDDDEEGSPLD